MIVLKQVLLPLIKVFLPKPQGFRSGAEECEGISFIADLLCNNCFNAHILDACSPEALIRLSLSSRDAHDVVIAYLRLRFNVARYLRPFFDDITSFRILQAKTGMLISGSTALQFFSRTTYPLSDLDLYVRRDSRKEVGRWLLDRGYKFLPNRGQHDNFFEAASAPSVASATGNYRRMRGVAAVFTFQNRHFRNVQIIAAVVSPLAVILHYHSYLGVSSAFGERFSISETVELANYMSLPMARSTYRTPYACKRRIVGVYYDSNVFDIRSLVQLKLDSRSSASQPHSSVDSLSLPLDLSHRRLLVLR
ncbi:hypothetical protein NM688_g1046 [Phlebia brevispora]|uniref:Uncharacterized protein n=1 Tax=Phlebia brevispora TaxID=194682 RepID=A0ACC1TCM8_9APHY|nr:hypothetical protein NM688_g1046 [Phlebia brevispora]